MPGPRASKNMIYQLADKIEQVTGIYPIPSNESPLGTEADRRYYWQNQELREWFDANGKDVLWQLSPHVTFGTGQTQRVLAEVLGDALSLLALDNAKSVPAPAQPYVSDDYITRNIESLTPASHHYAVQFRSDNPSADDDGRHVPIGPNGGPVTYPQTRWMNLTPEQLARIASVL